MTYIYRRTLFFLLLFAIPSVAKGQATAAATRNISLQLGGAVSIASPDYSTKDIKGFTIYGDLDYGAHFGLDGEIHDLNIITPYDVGESSYVLSLRYKLNYGKLHPYARVGAGLGSLNFQQGYFSTNSTTTVGIYAIGGGLDYALKRKIHIRPIDFEYQDWRHYGPHGLTPYVISIGAAYNF